MLLTMQPCICAVPSRIAVAALPATGREELAMCYCGEALLVVGGELQTGRITLRRGGRAHLGPARKQFSAEKVRGRYIHEL